MIVPRRSCTVSSEAGTSILRFACRNRIYLLSHLPGLCLWAGSTFFGIAATFDLLGPTPSYIRVFGGLWTAAWMVLGWLSMRWILLVYFSTSEITIEGSILSQKTHCLGHTWQRNLAMKDVAGFFPVHDRFGKVLDLYVQHKERPVTTERSLSEKDVEVALAFLKKQAQG